MADRTCPKCKTVFKFPSFLKTHIKYSVRCKLNDIEITDFYKTIDESKTNKFNCSHCKNSFTRNATLVYHNKNSKCGKLQQHIQTNIRNRVLTPEEIDNITLEEARNLLRQQNVANIQPNTTANTTPIITPNITNNNNSNNNNNNTINNIQNITINQNINIINPFTNESIPNLSFGEMLNLLESKKPEIEILKLVYSDIQNNNFFKYNMNKQGVAYLTSNNSIDTVQEEQFRQNILKNSKDLLKTMLVICTKNLSIKQASIIYSRIDNIETMLKDAIYDNDLTNYLESQFRQNSKNNKKKLTDFVSNVNDNQEVKEKFYKTIEEHKLLKDNKNIILTPEIPLSKINEELGDLTTAIELNIETVSNDFTFKKFEDSEYNKYMKSRIINEAIYIKKNNKSNFVDYYELSKRKEQILNSIDKMKEIHNNYKNGDIYIIHIPEIYKTETARKNYESRQNSLKN